MTEDQPEKKTGQHCTCSCKRDQWCGLVCFSKTDAWEIGFAFGMFVMFVIGLMILRILAQNHVCLSP